MPEKLLQDDQDVRTEPPAKLRHLPGIPETLQEFAFFDQEGILVVAESRSRDPHMVSFDSLLRRLMSGAPYPRKVLPLADFQRALMSQQKNSSEGSKTSIQQYSTIRQAMNLFRDACQKGASDIHIRVFKNSHTEIKYRVNGSLKSISSVEASTGEALCSAIYQAIADVSDSTYQPMAFQDARIGGFEILPEGVHGIRVASGPHSQGTFMVLRLLYDGGENVGGSATNRLLGLGYNDIHTKEIELMRAQPAGITIIAGPTGSGKSTTLKHMMESTVQERPELNILTVEDPPEYPMKGVIQIPVTNAGSADSRNNAFLGAIRHALRSDPDIIMVGEIRDAESARLAVRAAMTGHQVWTTLHANSAFHIIGRLADVMVSPENPLPINMLADVTILSGLIFQRLVKTLCPHCKLPLMQHREKVRLDILKRLTKMVSAEDLQKVFLKGPGCSKCDQGTSGRTVVAEVVSPDATMMEILRAHGVATARQHWLDHHQGKTIVSHALEKIIQGVIDPVLAEEVVGMLDRDTTMRNEVLKAQEL